MLFENPIEIQPDTIPSENQIGQTTRITYHVDEPNAGATVIRNTVFNSLTRMPSILVVGNFIFLKSKTILTKIGIQKNIRFSPIKLFFTKILHIFFQNIFTDIYLNFPPFRFISASRHPRDYFKPGLEL